MEKKKTLILLALFCAQLAGAAEVEFGGFVDTYYAYDFNRPIARDRDYTTQAVRNNEFNINLAYLDAKISAEKMRGRLALQFGTSVQSNYAVEPSIGSNSGASISRYIQEAYGGYQVNPNWWLDAGIMLSHIGMESWISKDNPIYLRSLVADYSPYYQAGIRNEFRINDKWSAQVLFLNGWQNISENNSSKSLGTQVSFSASQSVSLTYNTIIGNEAGFRHFHDFIIKAKVSEFYTLWAQADIGFQDAGSRTSSWHGLALIHRFHVTQKIALMVRGERYSDPDQVIARTGVSSPFKSFGTSLGVDYKPIEALVYRFEARSLFAEDAVFQSDSGFRKTQTVLAFSMGLTI